MLLRLAGLSAARKADIVAAAIAAHDHEHPGSFTVIAPTTIRIRKP
ncbi:MAG: hypothetical protein M3619_18015 [Myxococcota bacterium]|nr:hypothetical protein [Myxococcota bacterium]